VGQSPDCWGLLSDFDPSRRSVTSGLLYRSHAIRNLEPAMSFSLSFRPPLRLLVDIVLLGLVLVLVENFARFWWWST